MNIQEIPNTEREKEREHEVPFVNSIIYLEFLQEITEFLQSFYRKLASSQISDYPMTAACSENGVSM